MQKIDFVKNIETIAVKLESEAIIKGFTPGFTNPNVSHQFQQINTLLFKSKSNYDQIKLDAQLSLILDSLGAASIYEESNLSSLTTILRNTTAAAILTNEKAVQLYNFHNSIVQTQKLITSVLMNDLLSKGYEESMNQGVVVFQILIEEEGLATEQYIKIFSALNELVEVISNLFDESGAKSEIVLLDSGSDTNIGLKSGIETAKSLFLIFKEVWDYIVNHKYVKNQRDNQTLLDSLSVRAEINQRIAEGTITDEEGREYIHKIKTRTDDLIGMKVLPKQIVIESNTVENKKLLSEFEGLKLIKGDDN